MQPKEVPAGGTIFSSGDASVAVYVIEEGEVAITVNGGVEVARLHAGELFGESGVLERRSRAATATAITATTLLVTPGETFFHAFGMDNDRALALVKLLCRRLRSTTQRAAHAGQPSPLPLNHGAIRLVPDHPRLTDDHRLTATDITHLPFQVGNRYGGETLPIGSNHHWCIAAREDANLAAPHFEIVRRDGRIGVRDLGTTSGTIVNGAVVNRASMNTFVPLSFGGNSVIAGWPDSPYRFRINLAGP